jgi:hypothetical protein
MKDRLQLTAVWLAGLAVALVLVEAYAWRRDAAGIRLLLPEDRAGLFKPLLALYGGYVGGLLAFWFVRPFKRPRKDGAMRMRFRIALACTLLFNLTILYLVGYRHLSAGSGGTLLDDVRLAQQTAVWLSFVVAPVNLYYFGIKPAKSAAA